MTTIGAAWIKQREGTKEFYYSISIDKAILPFTLTEDKRLTLKENKNKGNNEKVPDFYLDVFKLDKEKIISKNSSEDDEECPC